MDMSGVGGEVIIANMMEDSSNDDEMNEEPSSLSRGVSESSSSSSPSVEEDEAVITQRLTNLYPKVDFKRTPLPREWNKNDKYTFLQVSNLGLRVTYRGTGGQGKHQKDAASTRANHPIPPHCGLYYFEVTVNRGEAGCMGIGLCEKTVSMNRLPGWDRYSYGYHGDDGNFFSFSGNGTAYGPTFTTGDVIGCGVNLLERTIFFTKNGQHLGIASTEVERVEALYPTVGLQTTGEIIDANFGQRPFVFDIESEMQRVRTKLTEQIGSLTLPPEKTEWMNAAVASWLAVEGHARTLSAFSRATNLPVDEQESQILDRKGIEQLIVAGRAGEAMARLSALYPTLLPQHPRIDLLLRCQHFVEQAAAFATSHAATDASNGSANGKASLKRKGGELEPCPDTSIDIEPSPSPKPSSSNGASAAASRNGSSKNGCGGGGGGACPSKPTTPTASSTTIIMETDLDEEETEQCEDGFSGSRSGYAPAEASEMECFRPLIAYGQQIYSLALRVDGGAGRTVNEALSAICIVSPTDMASHSLMQLERRRLVASQVNAAILEFNGRPSVSRLQQLISLCATMRREMGDAGIPAAALVDSTTLWKEPAEKEQEAMSV